MCLIESINELRIIDNTFLLKKYIYIKETEKKVCRKKIYRKIYRKLTIILSLLIKEKRN